MDNFKHCGCHHIPSMPPVIEIRHGPDWDDMQDAVQQAKDWAVSPDSPDRARDADSPTGYTMSAKSWAEYSKTQGNTMKVATKEDIDSILDI